MSTLSRIIIRSEMNSMLLISVSGNVQCKLGHTFWLFLKNLLIGISDVLVFRAGRFESLWIKWIITGIKISFSSIRPFCFKSLSSTTSSFFQSSFHNFEKTQGMRLKPHSDQQRINWERCSWIDNIFIYFIIFVGASISLERSPWQLRGGETLRWGELWWRPHGCNSDSLNPKQ